MHSAVSIDIAASPQLVFRLAADVERWPQLLPHYQRARRIRTDPDGVRVVLFVARRPLVPPLGLGLPVAWRARTWAEPERRQLQFVHVGGPTGGMDVTWHIEPAVSGSRVTIDHAFERAVPLPILGPLLGAGLWPAFIDRFFTRPIAGRTLATFKALAEALAAEEPANGGGSIASDRSRAAAPRAVDGSRAGDESARSSRTNLWP